MFGVIDNLPISDLLGTLDSAGTTSLPANVNELMAYATIKQRLGVDTVETTYRLNKDSSDHFRDSADFLLDKVSGDATKVSEIADAVSPRVFGFVWRNTAAIAPLNFEFTKSVEWRPATGSGLPQIPTKSYGPSKVDRTNTIIDSNAFLAGLRTRVLSSTASVAGQIAKAAFTGVTNYGASVARAALPALDSSMMGAGMIPGMMG
jgi:hypothetical protein